MSQHDYNIANQTFPATRTDLNNALGAIATNNAGNSAPSTTYANQWWFDSDGDQLYIRNKDNDAWVKVFKIGATSDLISEIATDSLILGGTTPTLTIGDGGAEDAKIIFDGNAQNFHIGLDDSTDKLTIGLGNALGTFPAITIDENTNVVIPDSSLTIIGSGNYDLLTLTSTDADGNIGPNLRLYRNSASPADNDDLGTIDFEGRNDNSQDVQYGMIRAILEDASDGSEDGTLEFHHMKNGSLAPSFQIGPDECVINESSNDYDFRVESNGNANMLFVDGGNDRVHVNGSTGTREFNVSGDNTRLLLYSTNNSTGAGQLQFGDADNEQIGRIMYEHDGNKMTFHTSATEKLRIASGGQISTGGETDSNVDAGGLCLNTGANDGRTLSFKNSDVAHGMTSVVQTDTYAYFQKKGANAGGLKIGGLVESGFIAGIELDSNVTQADNAETAGAEGAIQTQSLIKSGTGTTAMGADDNIFVCRNSTTQFIVKGDGELFSNQSATVGTFDEYEDAHLVRAYDLSHGKGVIDSSFDKFVKYNKDDLRKARLIGSDKEGNATPFVNITGMSRLHNGAIWQQYEKHQRLASAFYKLAEKTIGKEEADKLLTEEEIQLLN